MVAHLLAKERVAGSNPVFRSVRSRGHLHRLGSADRAVREACTVRNTDARPRSRLGGSNDPARLLALRTDIHIGMTVGPGHFNQLEVPEQVTPMIERFVLIAT